MKQKTLLNVILFVSILFNFPGWAQTNNSSGEVIKVKMHSAALENNLLGDSAEKDIAIYLPPGYNSDNKVYPVVYLLGGQIMLFDAWFGSGEYHYRVDEIMDQLISSKTIEPMIIVSPDIMSKFGSAWYTNSNVTGNWEDYIVNDVVNHVDSNYRTIKTAESRGISGWSAGGYGALKLAMKHPDVFNSVFSISAGPLDLEDLITGDYSSEFIKGMIKAKTIGYDSLDYYNNEHVWAITLYSLALAFSPNSTADGFMNWPITEAGGKIDSTYQKWMNNDDIKLIPDYTDNLKSLNGLMMESGKNKEQWMWYGNQAFARELDANSVTYTYNTHDGGHTTGVTGRMDTHTLPFFSDTLEQVTLYSTNTLCLTSSDSMEFIFKIDGTVYIVPENTSMEYGAINSAYLKKANAKAFEKTKIGVDNLDNGIYYAIGVYDNKYLSNEVMISVTRGAPEINLQIVDFITGEPLSNTGVTLNNENKTSDDNGVIVTSGCGEISLELRVTNHSDIDTAFFVYKDTTLVLKLFKDSYFQFVDRTSGDPIPRIMIRHSGTSSIANSNGFINVPNLRNSTFYFVALSSKYFTEPAPVFCNPGDTAIIELTRKKANIDFYIQINDSTPVFNATLNFGDLSATTDTDGKVSFLNVNAREEYQYSLNNPCFSTVSESIYLEIDTTISLTITAQSVSPEISLSDQSGDSIKVTTNMDGDIYLVTNETDLIDSIKANYLRKIPAVANLPVNVPFDGLTIGTNYWIVLVVESCQQVLIRKPVIVNSENLLLGKFNIYPNPTNDAVNIETPYNSEYIIQISDIAGKQLYTAKTTENSYRIDLSTFKNGIYLIRIQSNANESIHKLIKF